MKKSYIVDLATNIVGKRRLQHYLEKRKSKGITSDVVRQIFMLDVKQAVALMSPETLGRICVFGKNFDAWEYRDATIVTHGTNAWSAIFLSSADSGKTLLQKVAVATLLFTINTLINDGQPKFDENWMPLELRGITDQAAEDERGVRIQAVLRWES
ncbi:MAG: hypothetical protein AAB511_00835 [Patescibacteria group bacterium]